MPIWTLAKKDLHLLLRDRRALVILLAMPVLFIFVLGLSLGEGFGEKPDERLRISIVSDDRGDYQASGGFPTKPWSQVVLQDLESTAGIKVDNTSITSLEQAKAMVRDGKLAAVLYFGPDFSRRFSQCSFLDDGLNPMSGDGVNFKELDALVIRDPTQSAAAAIIEQVAQVTMLRVVLPWMIGRAFEKLGDVEFINKLSGETKSVKFTIEMMGPRLKKAKIKIGFVEVPLDDKFIKQFSDQVGEISLSEILPLMSENQKQELGNALQGALQRQFSKYKLTGKTWVELTKSNERDNSSPAVLPPSGELRYQILVPSYTVMFAFFLVLTVGWLFVAERREGTLKRLRAAPISHAQILCGKMVPCFMLSLAQGLFLLAAGKLVFGMRWGPDDWSTARQIIWLLPVVFTTSLAAMGMSMLVACLARTETQVAIYGTLLVLVLAGISGCLMPRNLMPERMKELSRIAPHAWALDAYSQLFISQTPNLGMVVQSCFVLAGFGMGFLVLAWWFLKLE